MCSCKELFYPLTSDSNNQSLSVYVLYHRLRTHDNYIPNSLHPKTISQSQIENFVKCMKTLAVCRKIGQNIVGIRGIFGTTTDYRHPERAFFSKIWNFWAWADKCSQNKILALKNSAFGGYHYWHILSLCIPRPWFFINQPFCQQKTKHLRKYKEISNPSPRIKQFPLAWFPRVLAYGLCTC